MVKVLTPTQIPGLDGLNVVLFIYFLIIIYIFKYDTCAVQLEQLAHIYSAARAASSYIFLSMIHVQCS